MSSSRELHFPGTRTAFQMTNTDYSGPATKDGVSYYFWTEHNKLRTVIHVIPMNKYFKKKCNEKKEPFLTF